MVFVIVVFVVCLVFICVFVEWLFLCSRCVLCFVVDFLLLAFWVVLLLFCCCVVFRMA